MSHISRLVTVRIVQMYDDSNWYVYNDERI